MGATLLKGIGVSSGIASGTAFVLARSDRATVPRRSIKTGEVQGELERFETALARAEAELGSLKTSVGERIGTDEAGIFAAQALVLRDAAFHQKVSSIVHERLVNVEAAVCEAVDKFTRVFDELSDAYLRERAGDIRDVGRRIIVALQEGKDLGLLDVPEDAVVVSDELLPSTTAQLEMHRVRGFVTERGGRFSHGSILARSMGTPAVSGVPEIATTIRTGDHVIVDGVSGVVFVNANRSVRAEYDRLAQEIRNYRQELSQLVDRPTVTSDSVTIGLMANVSKYADTEAAFLYNADGIGLYRTEFGFAVRNAFPTEDEQYEFLAMAAQRFHPRKVVFRLLDVGGDKQLAYLPLPASRNPSLAQRGIRLLLQHPRVLETQLRAFLRVSAQHPVSILLPVVGGVEEIRATRAALRRTQDALSREGKAFNPSIPLGAMIEVPAAAIQAASLAREVDFFSLGTNDLVQYVVAADREDDNVAAYYQPMHPAVLRLIAQAIEAAQRANRGISICGEMAGDPSYTELLLGLGLRELSVAPGEMLAVKDAIRRTTISEARALAQRVLAMDSAVEIEALLQSRHQRSGPVRVHLPDLAADEPGSPSQ